MSKEYESLAWAIYAAHVMPYVSDAAKAANLADGMLHEWRKRFDDHAHPTTLKQPLPESAFPTGQRVDSETLFMLDGIWVCSLTGCEKNIRNSKVYIASRFKKDGTYVRFCSEECCSKFHDSVGYAVIDRIV